jgi:hypothetical protein
LKPVTEARTGHVSSSDRKRGGRENGGEERRDETCSGLRKQTGENGEGNLGKQEISIFAEFVFLSRVTSDL